MTLEFNKIYLIQSLDSEEEDLTGTQLYDEVLQYFKFKHPTKDAELINVNTSDELFLALGKIKIDCLRNGIKPIIHFEIHGLEDKTGFGLNIGFVYWEDIYEQLIQINTASSWNLFITMAVCYGNYAMLLIKPRHPAPFKGIIGSFEELFPDDLYIRYNAFYQELLNTLDFEKALEALLNSNPSLPDDYRYINAEQAFKNIYQNYFDNQFSPDKIRDRFISLMHEQKITFSDRNIKNQFFNEFRATLTRTKKEFYEKDKATFFMFDEFPEHKFIYCVDWEPNYK